MAELATVERSILLPATPASIVNLHSFKEVCDFAKMIADTEMVPQHFQKNPQAIVVAIQWGVEIGVPPMQALQNIAVINGRPSIWGDLGKAIVQAHPELAGYSENYNADLKLAQVTIKRQRANGAVIEVTGDFSWQDAIDAKLSGKNTYQQYARDMLMWRAFWRAARATFADALRGLSGAEESRDLETVKPAKVSGVSDAAAELNDSLGKKEEEEILEQAEIAGHEPNEILEEMPMKEAPPGPHRYEPKTTLPDVTYREPAAREKGDLVQQCETHLGMMNIQKGAWLATARELHVDVGEKAASLKGLSVAALTDLEAKLREEVSGG